MVVAAAGTLLPVAEVFAPGIVSRADRIESCPALTPDGREFYFTVRQSPGKWAIHVSRVAEEGWSEPQVAPFSGTWSDLEPFISPDGRRLFFTSNRPFSPEDRPRGDYDIWFVERESGGWGRPRNAGPQVNFSGDQWRPSVSRNGNLYFSSQGLWRAEPADDGYAAAHKISDFAQNPTILGGHPYVAPDESYILTSWMMGPGGRGGWDLYVSFRRPDGTWTPSKNVGETVNTEANEDFPLVSPDGRFLFFSRYTKETDGREQGDIHRVAADFLKSLRD
jgi:WD40-like Beta Propeller Repeat